jgi:preprotein translocase subunit SecG
MDTMQKAVLIGHTVIALLIIILVLLQRGKGADAGAAFGAGASGTVFGARGSGSFFSRATAVCATAFFITSLTLAYLSSQSSGAPASLLDDAQAIEETIDTGLLPGETAATEDLPTMDNGEAAEFDDLPALEGGEDAGEDVPDSD